MRAPSLLAAALLAAGPAAAQDAPPGAFLLRLSPDVAALSMGTATLVSVEESDLLFRHPGALAGASGIATNAAFWESAATMLTASGAAGWWDGSVALGVQVLDYAVSGIDPGTLPRSEDALLESGGTAVSEAVASLGYARTVRGVSVGVVGKWVRQRFGPDADATGAVDVGIATELGPVRVALSGRNLGADLELRDRSLPLPDQVVADASFDGWEVGPLDLGAAASLVRETDGELVPAAGAEVAYWPVVGRTFVARVGVRRVVEGEADPFTLGGAFYGDDLGLEYAYQGFGSAGASHRVGVRWR